MFVSIVVDIWRSRALGTIAEKYDSQALEADALHFSTDVWSSGVVILGLVWFCWAAPTTLAGSATPTLSPRCLLPVMVVQ